MRLYLKFLLLDALVAPAQGQDRHDWQSLAQLHAGDRVSVVLKTGRMEGEFQNWTPQDATVGTVTAKREDVLKVEMYRHGGARAKHAIFGAMIGFGGGIRAGRGGPPLLLHAPTGGRAGRKRGRLDWSLVRRPPSSPLHGGNLFCEINTSGCLRPSPWCRCVQASRRATPSRPSWAPAGTFLVSQQTCRTSKGLRWTPRGTSS